MKHKRMMMNDDTKMPKNRCLKMRPTPARLGIPEVKEHNLGASKMKGHGMHVHVVVHMPSRVCRRIRPHSIVHMHDVVVVIVRHA